MSGEPGTIVRNTAAYSAAYAFTFLSNLVLVPFVVASLGPEQYGGVWVIVGALTAWVGLMDLGAGTSFVKYIAEYHARGDMRALGEILSTGTALYAAAGIAMVTAALLLDDAILTLAGVPAGLRGDALFVFWVGLAVLTGANIASPVTSVLTGIQRMDLQALVSIGVQACSIGGTVFVLAGGHGMRGLVVNNLAAMLLNAAACSVLAFRLLPGVRIRPSLVRMERARSMVAFGLNMQVSRLAEIVVFQTDRILTLRMFGHLASTGYDVGARLCSAARSASFLLISALLPAFSDLDAKGDRALLAELYGRGTRYLAVAATGAFGLVFVLAPDLLAVWMGEAYAVHAPLVRALACGYYVNIMTGAASSMTAALDRTRVNRSYGILVSLLNLPVVAASALLLGPVGIAAGTSLTLVIGAAFFLGRFGRETGIPGRTTLRLMGGPAAAGMAVCGACFLWQLTGGKALLPAGSAAGLLVTGGLFLGLYAGTLLRTGLVDAADRRLLRSLLGSR
ncbi:MAG: lipopolysaccharide biosynthesis protein [Bacteroidota bacterium]